MASFLASAALRDSIALLIAFESVLFKGGLG